MFKFKSKSMSINGDNCKTQEDYYGLTKISTFGFPHKPTCLAFDPRLSLMAIGTQNGHVRVYGAPGVSLYAQHKNIINIYSILFIPQKGRLITVCSDNSLHLWEINDVNGRTELQQKKSFILNGSMKRITAIYLKSSLDILYLGTMCGNIYTLNVETFEMDETVIYQDVVIQNIPDHVKLSQGCVRDLSEPPNNPDCVLIGYQQGLLVLWDIKALVVVSIFVATQSLECVTWHKKGMRFMSSHGDGSYIVWSTEDPSKPAEVPITPYGPFACKAINRILWKSVKGGDDYIIFAGGMPRAVHGEKSTLTIMCSDKHDVLHLSSRVIDFFTISDSSNESDFDNPHSLLVLLEEELIAIDLESEAWLPYRLPYLDIPHSSPVTCAQFCPDVNPDLSKLFSSITTNTTSETYSENEWPLKGGKSLVDSSLVSFLLVTGHENGCIKFWNVSTACMQLLFSFHTSHTFLIHEKSDESDELDDWPPFRKVGQVCSFDTLCDDPRLAIRKMKFHDISQVLIVGGAAGQILVLQLSNLDIEKDVKPTIVHLVGDYNAASFNGQIPLMVRPGIKKYRKGLHLQALIQLTPPASITALAFHAEWNIFAAGTSHGFLLFDVIQKKSIMSKCTLNVCGEYATDGGEISPRSQSLKRSLRESFRKLKIGKSFKQGRERAGSLSSELTRDSSREDTLKRESFTSSPDPTIASSPSPELRSFGSESESRHGEGSTSTIVQTVYLAQTFIINNVVTTPTFWAGTSNGYIYIYTITLPATESRTTETVTCQLGKELQLKHRAPILAIQVVDHKGYPLPDPVEVQHQRVKSADLSRSHRVLISTEEQMKAFTLPSMKSFCKYKLMMTERCHATQISAATFQNKNEPKQTESCIICLTNTNEIALYGIPDLRKRASFQYISSIDLSVFPSFMFSNDGKFIYMTSMSEFELFSLSSSVSIQSLCSVEIPEGARDATKSVNDIVLQVRDIAVGDSITRDSQEGSDVADDRPSVEQVRRHSNVVHENGATNSEGASLTEDIPDTHADGDSTTNGGDCVSLPPVASNAMVKRAPLARIDELNVSDDSYSNHSEYMSRTSYCGSK